MVRVKCPKCGQAYPKGAGHMCDGKEPGNDNAPQDLAPYDDKAWRREYMRRYMRQRRLNKANETRK
jgi:hypothetical protein